MRPPASGGPHGPHLLALYHRCYNREALTGLAPAPPRDADQRFGHLRLHNFVTAMIPIAVAFAAVYVAGALVWNCLGLLGGASAVAVFIVSLAVARVRIARGQLASAAVLTGRGMLAMLAIGALFVPWQFPALALIAIAAVVVVIPHVDRRALTQFSAIAVVVTMEIIAVALLVPPIAAGPPTWFQDLVLASAVFAAATLIVIMLAVDHERMRALLTAAEENATAARDARAATDHFLISAAHQFRTPMSTLLLQSETLTRSPAVDERMRQRLARLIRASRRLQLLMDSVLDISRVSSGTLAIQRTQLDVSAIVREVASFHAPVASDGGVELRVEADDATPALADPARVALIVSSLLERAIAVGGGQPAHVAVRTDATDIVVTVTDGGPSLPAGIRERVFERGGDDGSGDLGTGLWLVRELSRAMGGSVAMQPAPGAGTGTAFVVRLPRSAS